MIVRWLSSKLADVTSIPKLFIIAVVVFFGILTSSVLYATSAEKEVHVGSELDFPPYAFLETKNTDGSGNDGQIIKICLCACNPLLSKRLKPLFGQ